MLTNWWHETALVSSQMSSFSITCFLTRRNAKLFWVVRTMGWCRLLLWMSEPRANIKSGMKVWKCRKDVYAHGWGKQTSVTSSHIMCDTMAVCDSWLLLQCFCRSISVIEGFISAQYQGGTFRKLCFHSHHHQSTAKTTIIPIFSFSLRIHTHYKYMSCMYVHCYYLSKHHHFSFLVSVTFSTLSLHRIIEVACHIIISSRYFVSLPYFLFTHIILVIWDVPLSFFTVRELEKKIQEIAKKDIICRGVDITSELLLLP